MRNINILFFDDAPVGAAPFGSSAFLGLTSRAFLPLFFFHSPPTPQLNESVLHSQTLPFLDWVHLASLVSLRVPFIICFFTPPMPQLNESALSLTNTAISRLGSSRILGVTSLPFLHLFFFHPPNATAQLWWRSGIMVVFWWYSGGMV